MAKGETVDALVVSNQELDTRAMLSGKDVLARLEKVEKAKEGNFKRTEKDFWKPTAEEPELRGIYLGWEQGKKFRIHVIGRKDPETGKPVAMRVNGTAILTRELKKVEEGQPIRIVWEGASKTSDGNNLTLLRVEVLEE